MALDKKTMRSLKEFGFDRDMCFLAGNIVDVVEDSEFYGLKLNHVEMIEEFPVDNPQRVKYVLGTLVEFEHLKVDKERRYSS